jgi:ankyrin repeat protein
MFSAFKPFIFNTFTSQFHSISSLRVSRLRISVRYTLQALNIGVSPILSRCDADGQTPLHRACSKGYVDEAELFLKRNSNINQCDKLMKTPLILAVEGGHTKVVTMLVENKCDIVCQ